MNLYHVSLSVDILTDSGQGYLDSEEKEIDNMIIEAEDMHDAKEKIDDILIEYVNDEPESGLPIEDIRDINADIIDLDVFISNGKDRYNALAAKSDFNINIG